MRLADQKGMPVDRSCHEARTDARNYYECVLCRNVVVTVDVAYGLVPDTIRCRAECGGVMYERGYPTPWPPEVSPIPVGEWYRPSLVERGLMRKRYPNLWRHVLTGGLVLRAIPSKETTP